MDDRRVILYVGNPDRARRLASLVAEEDWHVLPAAEWREALAKFATYRPDTVVINATPGSELAEMVYFHLRSMSTVRILLQTDTTDPARWRRPFGSNSNVSVLNHHADDDVIAAVRALQEERYSWWDKRTA